jgi:hypothetical protein
LDEGKWRSSLPLSPPLSSLPALLEDYTDLHNLHRDVHFPPCAFSPSLPKQWCWNAGKIVAHCWPQRAAPLFSPHSLLSPFSGVTSLGSPEHPQSCIPSLPWPYALLASDSCLAWSLFGVPSSHFQAAILALSTTTFLPPALPFPGHSQLVRGWL